MIDVQLPFVRPEEASQPTELAARLLTAFETIAVSLKRLADVGHNLRQFQEVRTCFLAIGARNYDLSRRSNPVSFFRNFMAVSAGYRQIQQDHINIAECVSQRIDRSGAIGGFDDEKFSLAKDFPQGRAEHVFVFD